MSPRTVFLARLFGLFMVIVAIWILVDEPSLSAIARELVRDRPATLLLSLVCLASGLAVVLLHQVWSGGIAPFLVSLLGWLLLIRGVVLLFLPLARLESIADAVAGPPWLYFVGVVALGIGVILTYAGFRAPPMVPSKK